MLLIKLVKLFVIVILLATPAFAVDGEVYFSLLDGNKIAAPNTGIARGIAGMTVGQEVWCLRPWINIETRVDEFNSMTGHPVSVDYGIGVEVDIHGGIYAGAEHRCWHPIDLAGKVEEYNAITLKYKFDTKK